MVEGRMKASIIIPVYKQAQYLVQSIESALAQTYPDKEIIVVDDDSPYNTAEIARRYPVKLIRKVNGGLPNARNSGVLNSTGDVLLPLDADDWIDTTFLERTIPLMMTNVAIVAVRCQYFEGATDYWKTPGFPTLQLIREKNCIPVCSLIRREAFLETGGYPARMVGGFEDWGLWLDILSRGWKAAVLDEPLFHYRVKQESMFREICRNHDKLVEQIHQLYHRAFAGKDWT
jgi:glycosyltransferase involved in cell wall biosynthesis